MGQLIECDDFCRVFDLPLTGEVIEYEVEDVGYDPTHNAFYGKKHTEETKRHLSNSRRKTHNTPEFREKHLKRYAHQRWEFSNPQGEYVLVKGSLNQFCKDNNLNMGAMSAIHRGKGIRNTTQYKGWRKWSCQEG